MADLQRVSTILHEIDELERAIDAFREDADSRSENVIFDFAAIIQWGEQIAERLHALEGAKIPKPRSSFEAEDPRYKRALERARKIHTDAEAIEHELKVCLEAIRSLDDPALLWAAIPHLESELEALEESLYRFTRVLRSS